MIGSKVNFEPINYNTLNNKNQKIMKTENFNKLIQAITGRDFDIVTVDKELETESVYVVSRILPLTGKTVKFTFETPKNVEKLITSFLNQYYKKYFEPNPNNYKPKPHYQPDYCWDNFTEIQKEYAYNHHRSNMYSPEALKLQVIENMNNANIVDTLIKYGFYSTNYGIGIFVIYSGKAEVEAIVKLKSYLNLIGIVFQNEFSDARWVYRFIINLEKPVHHKILQQFSEYKF